MAECEYPLGWKGGTTEVTGVSQVVEDGEGVGGWRWQPGLIWAGPPYTCVSWPS